MQFSHSSLIALARLIALAAVFFVFSGPPVPAGCAVPTTDLAIWQVADGDQRFAISGTVEAVSYASNFVSISAGGQRVEVLVTPTTVIDVHGESGSIADIRKGLKIKASGVVRDGQKIAHSIVLK